MNQSKRDLFRLICAVALTGGVAACDAPADEDRIGPEDFRQSGDLDQAAREGTVVAPGRGGGLDHRGDYRLGTDLAPEEEGALGAPMGEVGGQPQGMGDQAGSIVTGDEGDGTAGLEGRRGMPADEDAETVSDVPGAGVSGGGRDPMRGEHPADDQPGGASGQGGGAGTGSGLR